MRVADRGLSFILLMMKVLVSQSSIKSTWQFQVSVSRMVVMQRVYNIIDSIDKLLVYTIYDNIHRLQ